jgi:hypothetical protein
LMASRRLESAPRSADDGSDVRLPNPQGR